MLNFSLLLEESSSWLLPANVAASSDPVMCADMWCDMNLVPSIFQAERFQCLGVESVINPQRAHICHEIILTLNSGNQVSISCSGTWWNLSMNVTLQCERQSDGLIQQSPPSPNNWLDPFCLHSDFMHFSSHSRQETHYFFGLQQAGVNEQNNLWFPVNKFSSVHKKTAPLTLKFWRPYAIANQSPTLLAVARIPNFPYVNYPGHDEICAGLPLEFIASFHTLCTSKILGMHKSRKSNEKSWRD